MTLVAQHEAKWALALVFRGNKAPPLQALQEDSLKQAFRRRARDTHPDRAAIHGRSEAELAKDFKDLRRAYETLLTWLTQPSPRAAPFRTSSRPSARSSARPKPQPRRQRPPPPPPWQHSRKGPQRGASSMPHGSAANAWWESRQARQAQHRDSSRQQTNAGARFSSSQMELGHLPRRSLLFAEFLHLSGLITWRDRIAAIIWQRQQRPSIGELATSWGYLKEWQVQSLIRHKRGGERFGEAAIRMGWLTPFQRQVLLGGQQRNQQPIGAYFVEVGILTPVTLSQALAAYQTHNRRYANPA